MSRRPSLIERLHVRDDVSVIEGLEQVRWWPILSVLLGPLLAALSIALVAEVPPTELPSHGKVMLAIFVVAAWYWITGAIPPFATAALVIGLGALFVGFPAEMLPEGFREAGSQISGWTDFVSPASEPVVILMLGGFVMSRAASKHGLDKSLARTLIRPFAKSPSMLVLGVMLITAIFSMWVSNTATAAMMVALVAPIAAGLPGDSKLGKAMVLAIPVGANIGGMGTPIGTPPNAIAFGALRDAGAEISFVTWTALGVPTVAVILLIAWGVLCTLYRATEEEHDYRIEWADPGDGGGWKRPFVGGVFATTVALWISSPWTGLPIGAVSLIPIVAFTATRLIDRHDVNSLEWDILILITGGLALGRGMENSGLASWMVGLLPIDAMPAALIVITLSLTTIVTATFMSNTAATNLLLPIALSLSVGVGSVALSPVQLGVAIALSASIAMSLPVSTPPNAIAYSSGALRASDFTRIGAILGVVGITLISVIVLLILPLVGLK